MEEKGVAPVIRIPWNDPAYIKKAYDVGAVGVMILKLTLQMKLDRQFMMQNTHQLVREV